MIQRSSLLVCISSSGTGLRDECFETLVKQGVPGMPPVFWKLIIVLIGACAYCTYCTEYLLYLPEAFLGLRYQPEVSRLSRLAVSLTHLSLPLPLSLFSYLSFKGPRARARAWILPFLVRICLAALRCNTLHCALLQFSHSFHPESGTCPSPTFLNTFTSPSVSPFVSHSFAKFACALVAAGQTSHSLSSRVERLTLSSSALN